MRRVYLEDVDAALRERLAREEVARMKRLGLREWLSDSPMNNFKGRSHP